MLSDVDGHYAQAEEGSSGEGLLGVEPQVGRPIAWARRGRRQQSRRRRGRVHVGRVEWKGGSAGRLDVTPLIALIL